MLRMLEATVPELPADRPRYLMGVGRPEDLLEAIGRGIDLFDCVMPTRNGRNAMAFTDAGTVAAAERASTSATSGRSKRAVPARPAAAAADTSAICSWPARCSGRFCSRSTTSPITSGCWPTPARRSRPIDSTSSGERKAELGGRNEGGGVMGRRFIGREVG